MKLTGVTHIAAALTSLAVWAAAQDNATTPTVQTADLRLLGSNPAAAPGGAAFLDMDPYFLTGAAPLGSYREVYPGIDTAGFADRHEFEYVFRLAAGADPDLIRFSLDNFRVVTITDEGHVIYEGLGMDCYQSRPVAIRKRAGNETELPADANVQGESSVGLVLRQPLGAEREQLNRTDFNIVPEGGQPGGPDYTYYMSRYEVTHEQFLAFLNDAQAATNSPRGANMYFDPEGNVWFNPAMRRNRHEIFRLSQSRLTYDASRPIGRRYRHVLADDGSTPYARNPITGVSWVGAVKYCNWLTVHSGRGIAELCYSEGTNAVEWAPVTATNWQAGVFSPVERTLWNRVKGFRLPMLDCTPYTIHTNRFNEFYKAAAWNATTNTPYGFGRTKFVGLSANSIDTLNRHSVETMPVGYFDGHNKLDEVTTKRNANYYGIYDLSGNVSEWLNDFGEQGSSATRALAGGSWAHRLKAVTVGEIADPAATSSFAGFRTSTTFMPEEYTYVHTLFCFHTPEGGVPFKVAAKEGPDTGTGLPREPEAITRRELLADIPGLNPPGAIYSERPPVGGEVPPELPVPEASAFAP